MGRETFYTDVFTPIATALEADLVSAGHTDAVEEWHGPPDQAVIEHVATLSGDERSSVIFGYDPEAIEQRDGARQPSQIPIGVAVTILIGRTDDRQADNAALWTLLRRVEDALSPYRSDRRPAYYNCQNVIYLGPGMAEIFADYMWVSGRFAFLKAYSPLDT